MPQETHNFTYNINATFVTVTATMKDAAGNILDTIAQTVDVPEIDNGNLRIATTTSDFAPSVEAMIQNLPNGAFTITGSPLSASFNVTDAEFQNVTDDQIRTTLQNYIANNEDYLNENTTGKVLIDIEHPRNFTTIENISDTDLDWFVDGVKRRVRILRELLPNARLGLYGVGSPQSQGSETAEADKKLKYDRALNRGFLENVDFISPVLYPRFGPSDSNYGKVLAGVSARQCRNLCDYILQNGPSVDVHPLFTPRIYNGSSNENGDLAQRELNEEKMRFIREAPLLKSRYQINQIILWYHPTNDGPVFAEEEAEYYRSLNYAVSENRRFYLSSPRTDDQILSNNGQTVSFRSDFIKNTNIPKDEVGYTYWVTAQEINWTDAVFQETGERDKRFIPETPEQFERMVFSGVDEDGNIDPNNTYPSFAKNWLEYNDTNINKGWAIPERDMAVLNHEFFALFYCLRNQFLYLYSNDNYESDGTPTSREDAPIVSPTRGWENSNAATKFEKWYTIWSLPKYPVDQWVSGTNWLQIVISSIKRLARMFRKRYGFRKIGLYGIGGYPGWWEGLTQNGIDNPSQYGLPSGQTYRGWMKFTTIRTHQAWENAGLFTESSPGAGDYLDKIACQPKIDVPTAYWSFPNGENRGLEVVIREMVEAFRPWKDKTLLMVNNYYSIGSEQDLTGQSLVDQYHDWLESRTSHNAIDGAQRINVNYRQDGTPPGDMSVVTFPPKLEQEQNYLNKYWFKYASDFDVYDFNFEWVDMGRWNSLPDNSKKKYWVLGYDGNYSEQDKYTFLYQQLYLPWYQNLWNDYTEIPNPSGVDRRPIYLANFGQNTLFNNSGVTEQTWRLTPITDDPGHDTFASNGRIKFIENGGILSSYEDGFRRLIIAQAGGWTNFGQFWENNNTIGEKSDSGLKGYNVNAYSCMEFEFAPDYRNVTWVASDSSVIQALGNMDGTQLSDFGNEIDNPENWIRTAFTTTGRNTDGEFGDSRQAWKAALDYFWNEVSDPDTVELYHQWDWRPCFASLDGDPENPDTPVDRAGGYDRRSMGIDLKPTIGATRTPLMTVFDRDFWDFEINGMIGLGFNALTWGISGNSWEDAGGNSSLYDAVQQAYGRPYLFEAIPLTSVGSGENKVYIPHGVSSTDTAPPFINFTGSPDQRYSITGHWGFFPSYFTNDTLNASTTVNGQPIQSGGRNIKNIAWDPSITEMHIIFDYGFLIRNDILGPSWSVETLKEAMAEAWKNGFIVGLSTLTNSSPQTRQENSEIRQWCLALNTVASSDGTTQTSAATMPDGSVITRPINPAESKYSATPPAPL